MSKTYLALTIGPIYRTIQKARKTRELWAASFLLSQFMRKILEKLVAGNFGEALSPDISNLEKMEKWHGAGIWNDNCYFEIHDGQLENLKTKLPEIIRSAKAEIIKLALLDLELEKGKSKLPLDQPELEKLLAQHFHCHAVLFSTEKTDEKVLVELGARTASAELRDFFPTKNDDLVSETMFRGRAVRSLYHLGFEDDDPIFTFYKSKFDGFESKRRLPSLLEIAVREFRGDKKVFSEIEKVINLKIQDKTDDAETDEENQEIIKTLKKQQDERGKTIFKKRHKYIAIVQSDGDGVGSFIQKQTDAAKIRDISKALMDFSTAAVEQIARHDALPVYAGGDDLLFVAPLRNQHGDSVFDLIEKIRHEFDAQQILKDENASLSFGISIFYYKYPLGEALENGRELLNKLSKKLIFKKLEDPSEWCQEKNALSFRVMLHGGQSFATVFRQDGSTWDAWKNLLQTHSDVQSDVAFISGVIHSLERLEWLLEAACTGETTEAFFKNNFNEARGERQKKFIEDVRLLAVAIFEEYGQLLVAAADQDKFFKSQLDLPPDQTYPNADYPAEKLRAKFCSNLLYSALRIIQFLNAEDHD